MEIKKIYHKTYKFTYEKKYKTGRHAKTLYYSE